MSKLWQAALDNDERGAKKQPDAALPSLRLPLGVLSFAVQRVTSTAWDVWPHGEVDGAADPQIAPSRWTILGPKNPKSYP